MNIDLMKERRKELGMTQQDLGDACGLSKTTIFNYENGVFISQLKNLEVLCDVLDVKFSDLMEDKIKLSDIDLHGLAESTKYSLVGYINSVIKCDAGIYILAFLEKLLNIQVIYLERVECVIFINEDKSAVKCDLDVFNFYLNSLVFMTKNVYTSGDHDFKIAKLEELLNKEHYLNNK